ncbi:alpha/beta hydrolase [Tsukamurella sp. 8F]|uniref:alpha/beta hydrolase n=1 Tax=unclassified Tsukamurella TaxID=2633480 RepID=UPI0023B8BC4A|nr:MULTISPECIES: alpha/beta hydrolase [unclassified Tsukamurella]MDF0529167.1 alpha/beta hydrolase [Tsukamurella sp. 8J]MDF0585352.1 alpha/beta hydrolase [Tsukamurella sp. 8F]
MAHIQGEERPLTLADGRELFVLELPGPDPDPDAVTVVFECGAATTRSSWALVQPEVGRFARAVVYDRSGLGRSAADPRGRTLSRMADDLADLTDRYPGPLILVGHSAGGPIARLAASRRPGRVKGLVLVDPTDEGADSLFGTAFRRAERVLTTIGPLIARTGLQRSLFRRDGVSLPPDARADFFADGLAPNVFRTQAEQARTFLDELQTWREAPPDTGDAAVTVVCGALPGDGMNRALRAEANAANEARAAASPNGRFVLAPRSAHKPPLTDPDVVALAIEEMVSLVNSRPA